MASLHVPVASLVDHFRESSTTVVLQLPLSPHSCPPPLMGIFRPCPKSNFRHLDFPCFRLAPGQDLIWFESTTLGFQIHSKEFPTRFQKCRGVPALITPITFTTSLSCTRRGHEEKVSWCTEERQACSLMSCALCALLVLWHTKHTAPSSPSLLTPLGHERACV